MDFEEDIIAAWRVIDRLRFASGDEVRALRQALIEIRDNIEEILA
jgi:hypothetical protein